jgi:hypothetical protein
MELMGLKFEVNDTDFDLILLVLYQMGDKPQSTFYRRLRFCLQCLCIVQVGACSPFQLKKVTEYLPKLVFNVPYVKRRRGYDGEFISESSCILYLKAAKFCFVVQSCFRGMAMQLSLRAYAKFTNLQCMYGNCEQVCVSYLYEDGHNTEDS